MAQLSLRAKHLHAEMCYGNDSRNDCNYWDKQKNLSCFAKTYVVLTFTRGRNASAGFLISNTSRFS